jgi:hypothetical protein
MENPKARADMESIHRDREGLPPRNEADRADYKEYAQLDADVVADYLDAQAELAREPEPEPDLKTAP